MKTLTLTTLLGALICLQASFADDVEKLRQRNWHQWRGPNADGVAPHADPPTHWDEESNIKWKVRIPGDGSSTPIIWDDAVFVLTAVPTDRVSDDPPRRHETALTQPPKNFHQFVLLCLERDTGDVRWSRVACEEVPHEGHHHTHTYAGSSAVTDGKFVYAHFGSRGTYCYDMNGELQWKRDLGDMRTRKGWGEAATPALHKDTLVVTWDQEDDSFIVALNAKTGETKWHKDRDEVTSWATPRIVERNGRTQVIVNGTTRVRSYDLDNGEVIWQCGGQTVNAIPSPVVSDGVVYVMSGYRGQACYAIPLDGKGDLTDTDKILWKHNTGTPYVPSPILYGDRLFFTRTNTAILSCLDAKTGKPLAEQQRLPDLSSLYASPVGAAGRIYFVDRDGTTNVIKHSPKLEVLATNKLNDPIDASPAIVGNQIFLRSHTHLYCIEREAE